jgi:hypothetical protein
MVTTVTTTTATALTTAAVTSLALIAIITLISLLIQKEIVSGVAGSRAGRLSKALNVAIVPLLIVFISTVVIKVISTLN